MKKWPKRVVVLVIAVLASVAMVLIFFHSRGKEEPPLRGTGIIDGIEVNLSSKAAGTISWMGCDEGDMVQGGQVVVALDSDDIKASVERAAAGVERAKADIKVAEASIESFQAGILSAEAEMRSAAAEVEKARARMEESKKETERRKELSERNLISKESYDQMLSAFHVDAASYDSSKERLNSTRSKKDVSAGQLKAAAGQLESARATRKEATANLAFYRSKLADTTIKTPVGGTVIFKSFEKGETVNPGVTILTVVDLNTLYARVDIDESKIGKVVLNAPAFVTVEGMPGKVFRGKVAEIGRHADFATQRDVVRGREDIKTFRVKVRMEDVSGILKPGMTVDVEIRK